MKYLKVQLESGSWRYITGIDAENNDFTHSIYPSTKIKPTIINLLKVTSIINSLKLKNIKANIL